MANPHIIVINLFGVGKNVAKAEWGMKRVCQGCSAHYYDLRRAEIVCPKCGESYDPDAHLRSRRGRSSAALREGSNVIPMVDFDTADVEDAAFIEEALIEEDADGVADDLLEDASDLGGEDDMSEVIDHPVHEDNRSEQ